MVTRKGKVVERMVSGVNSGMWERTLKVPAYIYDKGDNPGKLADH